MADYISATKGFGGVNSIPFNTYVPELTDNANIQNAFELFYFGNSEDGETLGDVSLYGTLLDFDSRVTANESDASAHFAASSNIHGVGAGNSIVGTGTTQTLTNKTLTSPKINENVAVTATSTELNYVDGVTSPIQTQLSTNTPVGSVVMWVTNSAPTGWLVCDGSEKLIASYTTLYSVIGTTYGPLTNGGLGGPANSYFRLPDLRGRVPIGVGTGRNIANSANLSARSFNSATFSKTSDAESVTLTEAHIPPHVHQNSGSSGTSSNGVHSHFWRWQERGPDNGGDTNPGDPPVGTKGNAMFGIDTSDNDFQDTYIVETDDSGAHSHAVDSSISGRSTAGTAITTLQPSTIINFIIKY